MSAAIISLAATIQVSLIDAPSRGVVTSALTWIEGALFGGVATGIAVIAVASIGFGMLSGRISVKRGITILLGCFILFGASSLARGLRAFSEEDAQSYDGPRQISAPVFVKPDVSPQKPGENSYDPYAGAAVPQ
jgi:type IV secretion system protein VirB2